MAPKTPLTAPKPSRRFLHTAERLGLTSDQVAQLSLYVDVLGKWQPKLNLIGPKTWADVWDRHVVDSLQCLEVMASRDATKAASLPSTALDPSFEPSPTASIAAPLGAAWRIGRGWADIGTGAGFPGIVLALATGLPVQLVESDQRKAAFQLAVKSATGAAFTVVNKRVEALPAQPLDWLFARAFAPLPRLLDWCAPLIDPKTQLLLHKGRQAADEIAEAAKTHSFEFESFPSLIDSDSVILRLHSLRSRR